MQSDEANDEERITRPCIAEGTQHAKLQGLRSAIAEGDASGEPIDGTA